MKLQAKSWVTKSWKTASEWNLNSSPIFQVLFFFVNPIAFSMALADGSDIQTWMNLRHLINLFTISPAHYGLTLLTTATETKASISSYHQTSGRQLYNPLIKYF